MARTLLYVILAIVILLVLVGLGVGLYFLLRPDNPTNSTTNSNNTNTTNNTNSNPTNQVYGVCKDSPGFVCGLTIKPQSNIAFISYTFKAKSIFSPTVGYFYYGDIRGQDELLFSKNLETYWSYNGVNISPTSSPGVYLHFMGNNQAMELNIANTSNAVFAYDGYNFFYLGDSDQTTIGLLNIDKIGYAYVTPQPLSYYGSAASMANPAFIVK